MEAAASVRTAVSTAVILRNFSNMTRLPRFLFGGEPRTWIGRPRTRTSNKAQARKYWETGGVHTPEMVVRGPRDPRLALHRAFLLLRRCAGRGRKLRGRDLADSTLD